MILIICRNPLSRIRNPMLYPLSYGGYRLYERITLGVLCNKFSVFTHLI